MNTKCRIVEIPRGALNAGALFVAGATLLMSAAQVHAQAALASGQSSARIGIVMSENNPARGVLVFRTIAGGPADKAGLRPGDSILAVNAQSVANPRELQEVVLQRRAGDALELSVNRDGWLRTIRLISVGQADLAKLSRPRHAAAVPRLNQGYDSSSIAAKSSSDSPSDAWENVRDPYLRATHTAFGE